MTNSSSQCPDANNDRAVAVTALRSMLADISGSQSKKPARSRLTKKILLERDRKPDANKCPAVM